MILDLSSDLLQVSHLSPCFLGPDLERPLGVDGLMLLVCPPMSIGVPSFFGLLLRRPLPFSPSPLKPSELDSPLMLS